MYDLREYVYKGGQWTGPRLSWLAKASVFCPGCGWFLFIGSYPLGFICLVIVRDIIRDLINARGFAGISHIEFNLVDILLLFGAFGWFFLLISGPLFGMLALIHIKCSRSKLGGFWLALIGILSIAPILLVGWFVWCDPWFNSTR